MRNTKIVLFELMLCLLVIYGIFILNKKANEKNEMQNTQNKIIAEVQEITEKDEHELENQETNIENEHIILKLTIDGKIIYIHL